MIDEKTGDVIATTTLQDAGIEVSVDENEVRGGKGNALLGTLHVSRDIEISLTDAEFRYEWLAKQLGTDVKTGAGVAYAIAKFYELDADKKIVLDRTPLKEDSLAIYTEAGVKLDTYTTEGKDVTFSAADLKAGDYVEVRTYTYATPPETQTIEFDNSKFASGVKAILETIEIDGDETITHTLQYQFDRAIPTGNFSISTASERSGVTQDFNLRVVKPKTSTKVGRLLRFPYVEQD
ncbi:MAG: hypothetical protein ACI35O_02415 [Bacillaceae bacterium]